MLKQETMGYIIEKMRGDCLTPLGTGKSSAFDELINILTVIPKDLDRGDREIIRYKVRKWFALRKPFLWGFWSNIRKVNTPGYVLEHGKLAPEYNYYLLTNDGNDYVSVVLEVRDIQSRKVVLMVTVLLITFGNVAGKTKKEAKAERDTYLLDVFGIVR